MTKEVLKSSDSIFLLTKENAKVFAETPGFYKFLHTDKGIFIGYEESIDHAMLYTFAEKVSVITLLDAGALTVTKHGDIWLNGISTTLINAKKLSAGQCVSNRSLSTQTIAELVGDTYNVSGNI